MQDTVGDQSASDAGSKCHQDEIGGALAGTELPLGDRCAGGIVVKRNGMSESIPHEFGDRKLGNAVEVRCGAEYAVARDQTRYAYAEAAVNP